MRAVWERQFQKVPRLVIELWTPQSCGMRLSHQTMGCHYKTFFVRAVLYFFQIFTQSCHHEFFLLTDTPIWQKTYSIHWMTWLSVCISTHEPLQTTPSAAPSAVNCSAAEQDRRSSFEELPTTYMRGYVLTMSSLVMTSSNQPHVSDQSSVQHRAPLGAHWLLPPSTQSHKGQ